MAVWHNISYFYTLYMWCVITLVTCRWFCWCNKIHCHNTDISIVWHIKAQNVNYYCNGPKDGPVNGLKHLVWCVWKLSTLDKKNVSIRTFPVLSSYNLNSLISLHTFEFNNHFYVLYIFICVAYLHFCNWFVISNKITPVEIFTSNYKHLLHHPNIYIHCFYLWLNIKTCLCPIPKFMTEILVLTTTCTCPLQILLLPKGEFSTLEVEFTIIYHLILNAFQKSLNNLKRN